MDLEVFSDPIWGLGGKAGITSADLDAAARYDEALVKPALLIADSVTLRTWREDMRRAEIIDANIVQLSIPFAAQVRGVVARHSAREMSFLGVSEDLRLKLKRALDMYDGEDHNAGLDERFLREEAAVEFARLVYGVHRSQYESLASPGLDSLSAAGVLRVDPWDDRELRSWVQAAWDQDNTSFDYGWQKMVDALDNGAAALLLDHGIGERLASTDRRIDYPSVQTLSNAVELLQMLDGLADAALDEILDIRKELAPYLGPFRGFLLSHASGMDLDPAAPLAERRRQAGITWEANVAPAVRELKAKVSSSKFLANLAHVAADGSEVAIGIGLGLATTLTSGVIGFTALAGLGTAALPTVVKATARTLGARKAVRTDSAYFIYDVERRLRRSRRS